MKKIIGLLFCILLVLSGCATKKDDTADSGTAAETKKLTIAYQYGLAYAPVAIVKEKNLLVDAYKNLTGNDLEVE